MRSELGDAYTETLRKVYAGRVPGGADLVTYWFEKGRTAIEKNGLGAAGFVATNSIRQGANRKVLERVCTTTRIFEAWSDEPWVNEGAAVRVSLVCQGWGECCFLDGLNVTHINADLTDGTQGLDLNEAIPLTENGNMSFFGLSLAGAFTIEASLAREWLRKGGNPNGRPNSDIIRPIWNGADVTRRASDRWVIDFAQMNEDEARLYELPFEHILRFVKPVRDKNNRESRARMWWRHGEARPAMREALLGQARFIATSETSKHRYFVWCPTAIAPEHKLVVIPRSDDVTFGILSSRIHVAWALAVGSSLEDRPVYTTSRCVEAFPFPAGLTPQDTASQQTRRLASGAVVPDVPSKAAEAIAEAAHKLNTLRDNWLNPPDWTQRLPEVVPLGMATSPYPDRIVPKAGHEKELSERTLTKLYNARPAWLAAAHAALDQAVATAYGWTDYAPEMPDETILQRLLALNIERSGA